MTNLFHVIYNKIKYILSKILCIFKTHLYHQNWQFKNIIEGVTNVVHEDTQEF